jgi:hypothetical protein
MVEVGSGDADVDRQVAGRLLQRFKPSKLN